MADSHDHAHHASIFRAYMIVAVALGGFTLVSFVCNYLARSPEMGGRGVLDPVTSFLIILSVAVVKATLVALVFMHVKWDWKNLYFMIVPIFILAAMMSFVFLPDGVWAWKNDNFDPGAVSSKH